MFLKSYIRISYIYIDKMIVPIQDIQGLVFNEYINLDNSHKIVKNWDDIIRDFQNILKI